MSFLFPKLPTQKIEGARLDNLEVTSSAYGEPIAIGGGTVRLSGNVIWGAPIREEKRTTTTSSGGKGGGGQKTKQIDYFYYANIAIGIAEGPAAEVLRHWADGTIIYDNRDDTPFFELEGLRFRFYKGTEQQDADPLIVADKGEADTPAYLGLVYIVYEDLPLADFGNRIPNLTFEINFEIGQPVTITEVDGPDTAPKFAKGSMTFVDWDRGRVYMMEENHFRESTYMLVYDLGTLTFIEEHDLLAVAPSSVGLLFHGIDRRTGHLVGSHADLAAAPDDYFNYVYDPVARVLLRQTTYLDAEAIYQNTVPLAVINLVSAFGDKAAIISTNVIDIHIHDFDTLDFITRFEGPEPGVNHTDGKLKWIPQHFREGAEAEGWGYWMGPDECRIYKYVLDYQGIVYEMLVGTILSTEISSGEFLRLRARALPYWDRVTGSIITIFEMDDGTFAVRWAEGTGIIWKTAVPLSEEDFGYTRYNHRLAGGHFVWDPDNDTLYVIDISSGELSTFSVQSAFEGNVAWWDDRTNCQYIVDYEQAGGFPSYNHQIIRMRCLTGQPAADVTLRDMVERTVARIDVDPILDVAAGDLFAIQFGGYKIDEDTDAASALIDMLDLYAVTISEHSGTVHFEARGGALAKTISEADFLIDDNRRRFQPYQRDIEEEIDLPEAIEAEFLNRILDYQTDQRGTARVLIPDPTVFTRLTEEISVNAVIATEAAKRQTEILLYQRWAEAEQFAMRLGPEALDLVPGDPVTISLDSGYQRRARVDRADIGADWSMKARVRIEAAGQYTSTALTEDGTVLRAGALPALPMKPFLWAGPLMRDRDGTNRSAARMYAAGSGLGQTDDHPGGDLYESKNGGGDYSVLVRLPNAAAWGAAVTALGDPTQFGVWDDVSTVDINMVIGADALESRPDLDVLNGANTGVLFKRDGTIEYFQWADVAQQPDGSYRLSRLLRGRRGTNTLGLGHEAGETFLVLDRDFVEGALHDLAEINATYLYKAVTFGSLLEDAATYSFADNGDDLRPYEPVHVVADESGGDILWSWIRRTRIGGEVWDGGDVPLAEDTEEYNLRIFADSVAATPLRTFNVTSPSATYANADIISDFGAIPSTIWYELAQVSAQVGDGFFKRREIEVT